MLGKPGDCLLAQQVYSKPQMVLAGAGDSHGFQRFVPGLPEFQLVGFHMLPGAVLQNGGLGVQGAVAGIELIFDAGGGAVVQHPYQCVIAKLGYLMVAGQGYQVRLVPVRHGVQPVDQHHLNALGGEIVDLPLDFCGACRHGAVLTEIVAVLPGLIPAQGHETVVPKEPPAILHFQPAHGHFARPQEVAPAGLILLPAGLHGAVFAEAVEFSVDFR